MFNRARDAAMADATLVVGMVGRWGAGGSLVENDGR